MAAIGLGRRNAGTYAEEVVCDEVHLPDTVTGGQGARVGAAAYSIEKRQDRLAVILLRFLKRMFWESLFFKMDKVVLFDNIHI